MFLVGWVDCRKGEQRYPVIFQLAQKGIKSNETKDVNSQEIKINFNSKMPNFNILLPVTKQV